MNSDKNDDKPQKPSFLHIALSTLAAAFGVQSNKNRERDFKGGSIVPYVVAGIIFTVVFITAVVVVVRLVLANAGI